MAAQKWVLDKQLYSALKRVWRRSPEVKEALDSGKKEYFVPSKHGKALRRVHYQCEQCKEYFRKSTRANRSSKAPSIQIDHIQPVVDPLDGNLLPDGSRNWNKQIARQFVERKGLQRLCTTCHKGKSASENKIRRQVKKERMK